MEETAKRRYEAQVPRREHALRVGRECAELTLPSLLPPKGWTGARPLNTPYQGTGARCVTHLSSKLLTTLFPPGMPSFRLEVPSETLMQAGQLETPPEIAKGLSMSEKTIQREVDRLWRPNTNLSLQLLTVSGNSLEFLGNDNNIRVFRLDQYVVVRDAAGNVLEVILEQPVSPLMISDALHPLLPSGTKVDSPDEIVKLYTWVRRKSRNEWWVRQDIEEKPVPGSEGIRTRNPLNPIRWSPIPGDPYGRGKCEEHLPDLLALDNLTKSLVEGSEMASWHILMANSQGTLNPKLKRALTKAKNGDIIDGKEGDVVPLQFANVQGLQVAAAEVERLTNQLEQAFLLRSSIQRNGERVTATELRLLAEDLEGALGGTYSVLAEEMQRERLERLVENMQRAEKLPLWSQEQVEMTITTGLAALSREKDASSVVQLYQGAAAAGIPQEVVYDYIKHSDALNILANGLGQPGLVNSEEAAAQFRQQRMMEQVAAQASATQAA